MRYLLILAALMTATPVLASGEATKAPNGSTIEVGTMLGTTLLEVTTALHQQGFEVRKSEMEDGKIEVYAVKGTAMREIYVDPQSGQVTRVKAK